MIKAKYNECNAAFSAHVNKKLWIIANYELIKYLTGQGAPLVCRRLLMLRKYQVITAKSNGFSESGRNKIFMQLIVSKNISESIGGDLIGLIEANIITRDVQEEQ